MGEKIPNSRAYIHQRCGGMTTISNGASDQDFTNLSNPFAPVGATFCSGCGSHFPLSEFAWADTGEGVQEFRERHRAELQEKTTPFARFLISPTGCLSFLLGGAALGAGVGFVAVIGPVWGAVAGAVVGVAVVQGILIPQAMRRVLATAGVQDFRQLT